MPPPATAGCALPAYQMTVNPTQEESLASERLGNPGDFARTLNRAFAVQRESLAPQPDLLILSGGSQHGAFGAGFLAGLAEREGTPEYKVVTGVSAGALLSTLAFLANQPMVARTYPDYVTRYGTPKSNMELLRRIFSIDTERNILDVHKGGFVSGLTKGSLASFVPLRGLMRGILSYETLDQIRVEAGRERRLIVGVTSLNDGRAYAIDLTQFVAENLTRETFPMVRECYMDALLASSTVPPAMPPVSLVLRNPANPSVIEKRSLFIDGGARFGVFWNQLHGAQLPGMRTARMIINGRLYSGNWDEFDEAGGKWSLPSVAVRSVGILTNQIYRFSVDNVERDFQQPGSLDVAFIDPENLAPKYGDLPATGPVDQFPGGDNGTSCGLAHENDKKREKPLEFYAEYMRCLVNYGVARGTRAPWNRPGPATQ